MEEHSLHLVNALYGESGRDTVRPQFVIRGKSIFTTVHHPDGAKVLPYFEIKGNKIYPTKNNPHFKGNKPLYEMRGEQVHTTEYHPEHKPMPVFNIKKIAIRP